MLSSSRRSPVTKCRSITIVQTYLDSSIAFSILFESYIVRIIFSLYWFSLYVLIPQRFVREPSSGAVQADQGQGKRTDIDRRTACERDKRKRREDYESSSEHRGASERRISERSTKGRSFLYPLAGC